MLLSTTNGGWHGAGLLLVLCCSLFVAAPRCEAQNLVPNSSFELNDTCPYTIGFQGQSKPLYWEKWNQSPDYFHTCAGTLGGVDTLLRVPLNGMGFQYPLDGDAYIGMYAFIPLSEFREYVGCQLIEPLEVGETYDLSFFANVAFGGNYWAPAMACNNMGMLFTMEPNIWTGLTGPPFIQRNYAHLYSTAIVSDTANWTLVSGSFVADSAYQYLVIGNFFTNALTDTVILEGDGSLGAYYFVDGVCVTKAGQPCEFTTGISEPQDVSPYAWPNPASDRLQVYAGAGTGWQVFDATGRLVETGVSAGELLMISVHDWALGEYVIRLEGKTRMHVRFVVMR